MPRQIPYAAIRQKMERKFSDLVIDANEHLQRHLKWIPREEFYRLAHVCFYREFYLRTEDSAQIQQWVIERFTAGNGEGFGPFLHFMSEVRKLWWREMGADANGNLPVEGRVIAQEQTVRMLLVHPMLEWFIEHDMPARKRRRPDQVEIGGFITDNWRMKCSRERVAKAKNSLLGESSPSSGKARSGCPGR